MSDDLRHDLAAARHQLAGVLLSLAARHGPVSRLVHRATQALRAVDRLHHEVDEQDY